MSAKAGSNGSPKPQDVKPAETKKIVSEKKGYSSTFWIAAIVFAGVAFYLQQTGQLNTLLKNFLRTTSAPTHAPANPVSGDWRTDGLSDFQAYVNESTSVIILVRPNGGGEGNISYTLNISGMKDFEQLCQTAAESVQMDSSRRYYLTTYSGIHVSGFKMLTQLLRQKVFSYVAIPDKDWFIWPPVERGHKAVQSKEGCLDTFGNPIVIETMSLRPRVFKVENFIHDQEITAIMNYAKELKRSEVFEGEGRNEVQNVRTSTQMWVPFGRLAEADQISSRIASCLGMIPDSLAEDLQVLRYEHGQHYHSHMDFFDPRHINPVPDSVARGRNRFLTVLFYLTDVEEGGETVFPRSDDAEAIWDFNYTSCEKGLLVKPRRAQVAMFYNLLPEGQQNAQPGVFDERSLHGACDVVKGVKWAANKWYYNKH
jgi:hypothetical protein